MLLAFLLVCMFLPVPSEVRRDRVDSIELNHFYDCTTGKEVFQQYIFRDFKQAEGRFEVRDWRLKKDGIQHVTLEGHEDRFLIRWTDGDVLREVRSPSFQETYSEFDPEQFDRIILPKEKRRGLAR